MTTLIIVPISLGNAQPTSMQPIGYTKLPLEDDSLGELVISTIANTSGYETMIFESHSLEGDVEIDDGLEHQGHSDMVSAIMFHREAVRRYTLAICRCCNGTGLGAHEDLDCDAGCQEGLIYQHKLDAWEVEQAARRFELMAREQYPF